VRIYYLKSFLERAHKKCNCSQALKQMSSLENVLLQQKKNSAHLGLNLVKVLEFAGSLTADSRDGGRERKYNRRGPQ